MFKCRDDDCNDSVNGRVLFERPAMGQGEGVEREHNITMIIIPACSLRVLM